VIRSQLAQRLGRVALDASAIDFRSSPAIGANAMALGGSQIVITDKLVEILNSDELAAVVAHELGHLHYKHILRLEVRQIGLSGVLSLLVGFHGANDELLGTAIGLGQSKYSREFESEADAYSISLMNASGLSPCLLASSLKKLEQAAASQSGANPSWFSSHPPTQVRINMIGLACGEKV